MQLEGTDWSICHVNCSWNRCRRQYHKIVGLENDRLISPMLVKANDPIASIYGAFESL